jgi:hypothetical protein
VNKSKKQSWRANLALMAGSVLLTLGVAELGLRLLPVTDGLRTQPVNESAPVFHFQPNRDAVWSKNAGFELANKVHVNNAGFVSDRDYTADDSRPLLAVIGDSYIEALMVRYPDTLQGVLDRAAEEKGRVYSFAASGAPLSQYLVWATHAARQYGANALVVTVVGNDFDESLARYKQGPGFHHYVEEGDTLRLKRVDYQPNPLARIAIHSALVRYALFNLSISNAWNQAVANLKPAAAPTQYVGNTSAAVEPERLALSEKAVRAFLDDLPGATGLPPSRIGFVVDGLRPNLYDAKLLEEAQGTYFPRMRSYFIEQARQRGFAVADLEAAMEEGARQGVRYEFPQDGHWSPKGHALAAEAARGFPFVQAILAGRKPE